jgi:flagellar L-ring protein precursor FlgH
MRFTELRAAAVAVVLLAGGAGAARAQGAPGAGRAQPAGGPDTLAAGRGAAPTLGRAAWLSDRVPLREGDILTVVVDEQTASREQVSTVATGNRSQSADLNVGLDEDTRIGPRKSVRTSMDAQSRDVGEAGRQGDLTAVLSVRVAAIEPNGVARVKGSKQVVVDGRTQLVTLEGTVRPEDISAANLVRSDRIADAVITYKGKKIGPRMGIVGKILAILWP